MVVLPLSPPLGNRQGGAAFVDLPGASVVPDATGPQDPFNPSELPQPLPISAGGYGSNVEWSSLAPVSSEGSTYDWALRRWLPVRAQLVSSDGQRYAYTEFGPANRIHIVDIATRRDAVVYATGTYAAIAYQDAGVVLVRTGPIPDQLGQTLPEPEGVWLLDPAGTGLRQVSSEPKYWGYVSHGYAWRRDGDRLLRLDLRGGSVAEWARWPGEEPWVVGFDQDGAPVVDVRYSAIVTHPEIGEWVAMQAGQPTELMAITNQPASTESGTAGFGIPTVLGDNNGVWLDTTWGLYLLSGGQAQKLSPITGTLAGPCH